MYGEQVPRQREHGDRENHRSAPGAVRNELAAAVYGPVVQARDITGDIHLHRPASLPPPNQLHPAPRLVGREAEFAQLDALSAAASGGPAVALVTGAAGVGKTALSLGWAHAVRHDYPDGQLYADLRAPSGNDAIGPHSILGDFLHALGVPAELIPGDLAGRAALYRSVTNERRILVLLDDALSAGQVRPLLPASPHSVTLVTSRYRLAGLLLRGARWIYLDRLDVDASIALLAGALGAERVARDRRNAVELAELCMRLPLALSVAAARLAARPAWSLGEMVDALAEEQQRLAALTIGDDMAVRSALDLSYDALDDATARLYRLLGLVPGETFGGDAAAALGGVPRKEARHRLGTLTDANLLTDTAGGRYRFHHALVRLHARQRAEAADPDEERHAALVRLLGWYLATAARAERRLRPYRTGLPRNAEPGPAEVTDFGGPEDALRWLETERDNLRAAIRAAQDHGRPATAWQLADAMWPLFLLRGHHSARLDVEEAGLEAARACRDRRAEGKMLNRLGLSLHGLGRDDEAQQRLEQAYTLWRRLGDKDREAGTLRRLGLVATARGAHDEAVERFLSAFRTYRELGADRKAALALVELADALIAHGHAADAVIHLEQASDLIAAVDDGYNRERIRIALGRAHAATGTPDQARRHLDTALAAMTALGSSVGRAAALEALGELAEATGRDEEAARSYEAALDSLGDHETVTHVRLRSRLDRLGRPV